ncbi:MAG: Asp-tRNA(Asn)/Glu-tRNA(Gln) amidotransferase subunit GatC [Planctomycetes bacterium]|nr:Asp-tRNA(Asn)/Glu-tRNA(Gln) amidotransferase subunit GatC [Planctomycetota bacterium]
MSLGRDEVLRLARLARLHLDDAAAQRLEADLDRIVTHVEKLGELALEDVEPTTGAVDTCNVFRPDDPRTGLTVEEALANAPARQAGAFRVPRVV